MAALTKCFRSNAGIACYILATIIVLAVIAAAIGVPISIWLSSECRYVEPQESNGELTKAPPVSLNVQWPEVPDEKENIFRFASVACAEKNCSKIGVEILAEGGSAVDAMIGTSLCLGVTRTTSSGIGGGGFMNYYKRDTRESFLLDYRETAPKAANATMYGENSTITSKYGGGSIAVPGEIAGMWEAHQKHGKLPWARLFKPSIELAEKGFTLNEYVGRLLAKSYDDLNEEFRGVFTNADGSMKQPGDTVVLTKMAETYKKIADEGVDTFYNGTLRDDILADLQELDGNIITAEDLEKYRYEVRTPINGTLRNGGYTMLSLPPPSGGIVLQHILRILDGYNFNMESVSPKKEDIESTATTYHRIVEAMKFAYALRSKLGDPAFADLTETMANMTSQAYADSIRSKITDDKTHDTEYYGVDLDPKVTTGTSQISILAANGDAVSATTSVNFVFGCKRMGKRTGIVFNNLMDDFALPGKPSWSDNAWVAPSNENNWIEPGKRPLSSMSPTVVTDDKGDVLLVTGGSGGSKIITAVASTAINNLWFGMNLTQAVSRPRLHHQLLPTSLLVEDGFPGVYKAELVSKGHELGDNTHLPVSDSVSRQYGVTFGVGDPRREGVADGY